ncbi:VOC family protein [Shimia sediminis]|uniref:VOC family protein n=1 Tax=Shimia sediminis TaxID=2497945 RepID=UPI000F8CA62C|nr:VOC family protein [Shimia sediminis]
MPQHLHAISLVVPDYDPALDFYVATLGFDLREDTDLGDGKRWVVIAPDAQAQTAILLARAADDAQRAVIGNQFGGRIGLFLHTDDFARDHATMVAKGVVFEEEPRFEPYGTVAVWRDPFGHRWDLLQLKR